jgi:hypothetical protein
LNHPSRGKSRRYAAGGATLACVLLFVIPTRRRRWRTMLGIIVLFAFSAFGIVSCGGGGGGGSNNGGGGGTSNPGTTAGTYTVTVTGTAGSTSEATTVTLIVN